MPGNELVQSLARGLDLLRLLAESDHGLRLSDMVAATGLRRPTLHNLLRTLASRDFVTRDGREYGVGPAMYMLVAEDASSAFLRKAEGAVRLLSRRLPDAIVSFCEPVGGEALVRFRQYPDRLLMERNSGAVLAPYQTASGLAFLAYADAEVRQALRLRQPFHVSGASIWQTEARLEEFLAQVRATGYVLPPFCQDSGFKVAAAPHLAGDGRLLGVLGAAWHVAPEAVEQGTAEVLAALREAAEVMRKDA